MGAGVEYDAGKFITSFVFSFLYLQDCITVNNLTREGSL